MSIAIFASAFYPHVGGVEELCRQLAHAYIGGGLPTIILTNRWPRSLPRYELHEGIPVYRLPFRVPEGSLKAHVSYRLTHASVRLRVQSILTRHGVRLLHVQCVSSNGYYALLAHRATGLPLVVSAQGERTMDAGGLYQRSPFANRVLRDLLAEADLITACSQHTLDDLERYIGRPLAGRGAVIYNGIRLADFDGVDPFPHRKPYVLAIGRLVPQKGFDILIRAFARAGIAHDLIVAGEGPERQALDNLVRELALGGRVVLLGRADRPTAVALFKGCSFFVLPSRMEPLGIVNLEAMAAAKAVIASRVGGVPEIVTEGKTGLLFPSADEGLLAAAIQSLGSDAALCARLGAAGRQQAERFDWASIAEQYHDRYRGLLTPSKAAPQPAAGQQ